MPPLDPIEPLISQRSGSIGSSTYGHNQYGPWERARTTPLDPATALQAVIRGAIATLTARWATLLTPEQRGSWDLYSLVVSRPGRLGRRNNAGGLPHYIRANVPRIQANLVRYPVVDTAPKLQDLGDFGAIGPAYLDYVENSLLYHFNDSDTWTTVPWSGMLCWISEPTLQTVNFFKGPYRYAGIRTAPIPRHVISPARFIIDTTFVSGDRLHFRTRVTRNDARLSQDARMSADRATAAPPVCTGLTYIGPSPDRWLVTFDQDLEQEAMRYQQWRLTWSNQDWNPIAAVQSGNTVTLTAVSPWPRTAPNRVRYLTTGAPPLTWYTLHGAATGLAVPAFDYTP